MKVRIPHAIFNPASLYSRWHAAKDRPRILAGALAWWQLENEPKILQMPPKEAEQGDRIPLRPTGAVLRSVACSTSQPRIRVIQLGDSVAMVDSLPGGYDNVSVKGGTLLIETAIDEDLSASLASSGPCASRCILFDSRSIRRLAHLMNMAVADDASTDGTVKPDEADAVILAALDEDRLYTDLDVSTTLAGLPDFDGELRADGVINAKARELPTIFLPNDLIAVLLVDASNAVGASK
jgi:hypothetical protein